MCRCPPRAAESGQARETGRRGRTRRRDGASRQLCSLLVKAHASKAGRGRACRAVCPVQPTPGLGPSLRRDWPALALLLLDAGGARKRYGRRREKVDGWGRPGSCRLRLADERRSKERPRRVFLCVCVCREREREREKVADSTRMTKPTRVGTKDGHEVCFAEQNTCLYGAMQGGVSSLRSGPWPGLSRALQGHGGFACSVCPCIGHCSARFLVTPSGLSHEACDVCSTL